MTFKINELVDNIEYILIKGDISGYLRKIVGNKFYKRANKRDSEYKQVQLESDDNILRNKKIYQDWVFTCKYPETIEEAAKLLDAHYPGWAEIVKNPVQSSGVRCVLGQLYETWGDGLFTLFNIETREGDNNVTYGGDVVFGNKASNSAWNEQIALRAKKVEPKLMTFWEAMKLLTEGQKVRRKTWSKNNYWMMNRSDSIVRSYLENTFVEVKAPLGCCLLNDWELYTELTFSELKVGEKFTVNGGPVWIKSKSPRFAVAADDSLEVFEFESTRVVERVE